MNLLALIISTVALIVSGVALYRIPTAPASPPDAGTLGAGGSGRR